MSALISGTAPVTRRVRAYFAPVNRAAGTPTVFDASGMAAFPVCSPPVPWIDLGWGVGFARKSDSKIGALVAGAPGVVVGQVRTQVEAEVRLEFESWGKLQMALASGSQQMNVLSVAAGAAANGSGGVAAAAVPLLTDSTAAALDVGTAAAAGFTVGELVAVDVDYAGQVGFVGSGVSGGYVKSPAAVASNTNYVRRVTLNVARITSIVGGVLGLGSALLAGVPAAGMQVCGVVGFCDREGGSFFQEWSALFVAEGEQGDRVIFHYPRLQTLQGSAEESAAVGPGLNKVRLAGAWRALPVVDANDGEMVVCFRSYLPGVGKTV
jgi:hypothetical protein